MRALRAAIGSRVGVVLCLLCPVIGCEPQPVAKPEPPALTSPRTTEELIAFVERAAAVVQAKGSDAFAELGRRPSTWSHDDTYLFIAEAGTNRIVVHGADRTRLGADLTTIKGAAGRPCGRWGLGALAPRDHGGIFYKRARPAGGAPVWKASYLKRVDAASGESFIVGSGVYDLKVDRRFVTELVDMAVARIQEDGRPALKLVRERDGPFVYQQTQGFVIDTRGGVR